MSLSSGMFRFYRVHQLKLSLPYISKVKITSVRRANSRTPDPQACRIVHTTAFFIRHGLSANVVSLLSYVSGVQSTAENLGRYLAISLTHLSSRPEPDRFDFTNSCLWKGSRRILDQEADGEERCRYGMHKT